MSTYTPSKHQEFKSTFDREGYLIVKDLVSPSELAEIRATIDRAMEGTLKPQPLNGEAARADFNIGYEPAVKDDASIPRHLKIRQISDMCHMHPFFWKHATRPEILDVVEALIGPDIKIFTDTLFVKPARHGTEIPIHQDASYWNFFDPPLLMTCWLAIDDSTIENGCVRVIPGSHRAKMSHKEGKGDLRFSLNMNELDLSKEVPVTLKAGSAMFHHAYTVHRSLPNQSDRSRRGLACIYLPSSLRQVKPFSFPFGWKQIRGKAHAGCVA